MLKKIGDIYSNFNVFYKDQCKKDLTWRAYHEKIKHINVACQSAANGDMETLVHLHNINVDLNEGDYDNRTPLHLAADNENLEIIKFLVEKCKCKIDV